ncbi:50S ribosomal protein L4 [bacterium BMS3Bbin03]|nr:50S ribosomal protein L4 [bacterium BMS3Bbin03]HDL78521.1 50S ribosomal protein L4 [Bacteroidota bacterium]HDZ12426.1 50S ribosomal protein L4 [Bacteroidota bacterium]
MKADVFGIDGTKVAEDFELPENIFAIKANDHAIYLAVKAQMTNARQGTASTKNRALVAGGGKKPWKQKGRGTSRAGTIRSPLWKGGGTIFGPQPHPYSMKVNKKIKKLARKSAFSYRAGEGKIVVVDDFTIESGKTKDMYLILKNLGIHKKKALFLIPESDSKITLASRNIPNLRIKEARNVSTYELLDNEVIVIQKSAVTRLQEVFGE